MISSIIGELQQILQKVNFFSNSVVGKSDSRVILSPSDHLYLNTGFGNIWFNTSAGTYSVWRQIY
jgi:hypothetical protein